MQSTTSNCKIYAPFEVVIHNTPEDCWVSFLGKVYDITPLFKQYEGQKCIKLLTAMAGKDISHLFDEKTGDIRSYIHPVTYEKVYYYPLPHVEVSKNRLPWWKKEKYQIGILSKRIQTIKILNTLSSDEVTINVCCEDKFTRILERYKLFNDDADSYTWRYLDKNIEMDKTLEENGILDERNKLTSLGLPESFYIPTIFIYYNDDFKWENDNENNE